MSVEKIVDYMHNNIPTAVFIVLSMFNRYLFDTKNCTDNRRIGILLVFTLLSIIDCVWTIYKTHRRYIRDHPRPVNHKWMHYAAIQCIVSVLSLFSLTYYLHDGVPFNCFFNYQPVSAEVLFYLSFAFIWLISWLEHYYWTKEPGYLPQHNVN